VSSVALQPTKARTIGGIMLENTIAAVRSWEIKLRNTIENRKQILVHYYPSETKGRVYKADYFDGYEVFFTELGEESCKAPF
jgi:hypothetical protein